MERKVNVLRWRSAFEKHRNKTHHQGIPPEHPESEADHILPGFPAAVHRTARIVTARPAGPAECCVHGNDFCSLRYIWAVGPRIP